MSIKNTGGRPGLVHVYVKQHRLVRSVTATTRQAPVPPLVLVAMRCELAGSTTETSAEAP